MTRTLRAVAYLVAALIAMWALSYVLGESGFFGLGLPTVQNY